MPLMTIKIEDDTNHLHAVEINDTVITLFYKDRYRNSVTAELTHSKDKNGNNYRFLKHDHAEHKMIHQDSQLQCFFHRHYDLGRPVQAEDVVYCLSTQLKVARSHLGL